MRNDRSGIRSIARKNRAELQVEALEERYVLSTDPVLEWNAVLLDAIRVGRTAPPVAARGMAIVHSSMYDAVNAIDRTHAPFLVNALAPAKASIEAAVAAAAHTALVALFPSQETTFDNALTASLANVPDGQSEQDGVALGESVANEILQIRSTDGASIQPPAFTGGSGIGEWRPTPPGNAAGLLPQWPAVTAWCMASGDELRPDGIPDINTPEYTAAYNQVKAIGKVNSATRTPEQTAIALFWANGPGTSTPPGHWNVVAQIVSTNRGDSLVQNARTFALLNLALADAAIVSWDAKYEYNFWRPVTAIREGENDANTDTAGDSNWTPLLTTPPFPAYTSGHSTFSGAAAAVLSHLFGQNATFVLPSEDPNALDRPFTSFQQAADESGVSRIYAGIHYSFDNVDGLSTGATLGNFVAENFLKAVTPVPAAGLVDGTLVVTGTDRNDQIVISQSRGNLIVRSRGRTLGSFALDQVEQLNIDGRDGNDIILVSPLVSINAEIFGGKGHDIINSGSGHDRIFGEDGSDLLFGGNGDDLLDGGAGSDFLFGGLGNDTLTGGAGRDLLHDIVGGRPRVSFD